MCRLMALLVLALVGCGSKTHVVAVEGGSLERWRVLYPWGGEVQRRVEWWVALHHSSLCHLEGKSGGRAECTPPAVRGGWRVVREQGQAEVVERVARRAKSECSRRTAGSYLRHGCAGRSCNTGAVAMGASSSSGVGSTFAHELGVGSSL